MIYDDPMTTPANHPMPDSRHTTTWQALRTAWAPTVAQGLITCWRCHQPIQPTHKWQLGHHTDHILGGTDIESSPEHQLCNLRAGGILGNQRKQQRNESDRAL